MPTWKDARTICFFLAVILGGTALLALGISLILSGIQTPAEDFATHLRLVDEGRIDEALEYLADDCDPEALRLGLSDLKDQLGGMSLAGAFKVTDTFRSKDGDRAMLRIRFLTRESWQLVERQDGRWKMRCTDD